MLAFLQVFRLFRNLLLRFISWDSVKPIQHYPTLMKTGFFVPMFDSNQPQQHWTSFNIRQNLLTSFKRGPKTLNLANSRTECWKSWKAGTLSSRRFGTMLAKTSRLLRLISFFISLLAALLILSKRLNSWIAWFKSSAIHLLKLSQIEQS